MVKLLTFLKHSCIVSLDLNYKIEGKTKEGTVILFSIKSVQNVFHSKFPSKVEAGYARQELTSLPC